MRGYDTFVHWISLEGYTAREVFSTQLPQRGRPRELKLGTEGSFGLEQLKISRGDIWNELSVSVRFEPRGIEVQFPESDIVDIPAEVTTSEPHSGELIFKGTGDGKIIYSEALPYKIREVSQGSR